MEIKKEEIEKYLADGYTVSQETKYVATKLLISNELLIGTFTEHGIYAGIAKGKQVYVKLKDEPKQLTWEEAVEYPKYGYHLPTKEALMIIHANKDIINKALVDNGGEPLKEKYYWSSTKDNNYNSWILYMGNGGIDYTNNDSINYVRAVVAF